MEPVQPEAPQRPPVRQRESQDYADEHRERGHARPQDEHTDPYAEQPWNRPVAKGVPPCYTPNKGSVCAHTVEAGETLSSIAQQHYGFNGPRTIGRIVAVNPGMHPDRIYTGQVVYLPCGCTPCGSREPETASRYPQPGHYSGSSEFVPISAF